jgi:hypothetical protein
MRDKETLMRQCKDLIDQDKLETLFRVYGLTDTIKYDMDGTSSLDSYAEIPSTPAFAVRPDSSLVKLGNKKGIISLPHAFNPYTHLKGSH